MTVFADYCLEWNPNFKSKKAQSIEEMQQKRLAHSLLMWKPEETGTFLVGSKNPFAHKKVSSSQAIARKKVIRHV